MENRESNPIVNLGDLTRAVESYQQVQEEISHLLNNREALKSAIIDRFKQVGISWFNTPSRMQVRIEGDEIVIVPLIRPFEEVE